ncbi:TetR/AcrR family transcriptional regulator [Leucobacter chromiiresistens]|uniref:Regulatory protein, tetR family n=1 Tax=Leucobacter chromiiresistens TaxID=1079994 RepID=A0A1H0YCC6_9MICO|nr:TetR family transcriptional regulator [Leucobacter chromiiresistens]SDQ12536.1 regulatory protein, tetR family [Leucobacter chromiiresistens]
MRNTLADVVSAALRVLDEQGLEGCSMRRVAAALDVQPSALYHHVPDKQTLLARMADVIVGGVSAGGPPGAGPSDATAAARRMCLEMRRAMLAVRDGADVVATAAAFRLGSSAVEQRLAERVGADGARALLFYTFGQAQSTQTHLQAASLGALIGPESGRTAGGADAHGASPDPAAELDASFERGLDIIIAGLRGAPARAATGAAAGAANGILH